MNKKNIISTAVVLVVALVAFCGGTIYGKSHQNKFPTRNQPGFMGMRNGDRAFGMGMGGFISGQIISKDDKSITLKLLNGGSKIVFFSGSTKISKSVDGTTSDLETGKEISISGTPNSDGSISASAIQIRPNTPPAPNMVQ